MIASLREVEQVSADSFIGSIDRRYVLDYIFQHKPRGGPFMTVRQFHDWFSSLIFLGFPDAVNIEDPYRPYMTDSSGIKFSHGDLHRGNIIISKGKSPRVLAVIDWEQAGWYLEYWEWCKACYTSDCEGEWRLKWMPEFLTPYDDDLHLFAISQLAASRFLCASSSLRWDQKLPFYNLIFSMSSLSFDRKLAQAVCEDVKFTYRHITDSPTSCPPLFSPPPGVEAEQTECERHFFAVSISPEDKDGKSHDNDDNDDNHNDDDELFVFAIEVLIYTTPKLTTLFVSKADSTGYLYLLNSNSSTSTSGPSKTSSFIRNVSNAFLSHLVRLYQRSGTRLVLSLFARSQSQYLFPGSVENSHKHILDDRGLIKWWSRVVDPILRDFEAEKPSKGSEGAETETSSASATAYLIVPGCDTRETRNFFPSSSRTDLLDKPRWVNGYPLHQICASPDAPPRSLVPRFPDDPKARFLTDLDDEVPDAEALKQNGQWRSVKTLEQFWELMAFRQECSAGRLVGFLWMVVNPTGVHKSDTLSNTVSSCTSPPNPKPTDKPMEEDSRKEDPRILISNEDYDSLSDCLLDLDFADRDIGVKGTMQWLDKLSAITGQSKQGRQVIGEAKPGSSMQSSSSHPPSQQATAAAAATTTTPPTSNLLDSGLIRKRKRRDTNNNAETTPAAIQNTTESEERQTGRTDGATLAQMQAQPTINVLTASLIKKKKKREQG